MTLDWESFSITVAIQSFLGGSLIGIAAVWLAFSNGKIAGISGIFGRLVEKLIHQDQNSFSWQASFIIGLVLSPWAWLIVKQLPDTVQVTNTIGLLLGGALVGLGTRVANGCTSGHGICGLSRLSLNSLIAVISFMLSGIVTVCAVRHLA